MMKLFKASAVVILLSFFVYCGTLVNGTSQEIAFSSIPTGAKVTIGGKIIGNTPLKSDLKRKDTHFVKVELEGYQSYEMAFTRKVSGWVWGNILLGGLIGLAIDAHQGGMYKLIPEQLNAELKKNDSNTSINNDNLYIFVTLIPNPNWEKIGQLTRNLE